MAKPMSENESLRSLIFQMQDALWVIWESYHCKKMPDAEHYSAWNRVFEALEEARLFFSQIHLAKEKKAREENREGNKQKEAGYHYNRGLIVCDACHQSFYCSEHFHNHLLENGVCPVSWGLPARPTGESKDSWHFLSVRNEPQILSHFFTSSRCGTSAATFSHRGGR